ncbi:hypothetical protein, conserved in T. vivax, partial [Trypanosoma vivax Y486]
MYSKCTRWPLLLLKHGATKCAIIRWIKSECVKKVVSDGAEKLNESVRAIFVHSVNTLVRERASLAATLEKIETVLRSVNAALAANTVFRASVLLDFYTAFEYVQRIDGDSTFGHENVSRNGKRTTTAQETFEWLTSDFSSCSNMTTGTNSGYDGDAKVNKDDGDDYYDRQVDVSDAVDTDNCGVDNNGTADRPLRLSEGTAVHMYGDLVHLRNSKIHFWDEVAHDARCAIKGVNVSTHISQKEGKEILTQNMWREGVINLTDIIRRSCTRAGDSEIRVGARLEACYSLQQGICGVSEVFGRSGLGDELGFTDNFGFLESMFGYGGKNVMEVCPSFPDSWKRETELSDELISVSAALHKLECAATNSAVGWLRLRFDTALNFMKRQFTLALNNLSEAESQVKGVLLEAVGEARETLCTCNAFLLKEVPAVDELKKWIDATKKEAWEVRRELSLSAEKVSLATLKTSEVMEV